MSRVVGAVGAVVIAGSLQLHAAPAAARDALPCVSKTEFNSVHVARTRADLEARWDVAGTGRRVSVPGLGNVTQYKRCGEHRRDAWYGVGYVPEDGRLYGYTLVAVRENVEQPAPAADPDPCPECSVVSRVSASPALRKRAAFRAAAASGNESAA